MKKVILSLLFVLATTPAIAGGKFTASVKFKIGLGFDVTTEKVRGSMKKTGADSYSASKIKASVRKLTTDNDSRDGHMRERFGKNKSIVIEKAIAKGGKGIAVVSMNGIKKKEKFTYKPKGKKLKINMSVNMSDYKLKGISYKDIVLKDKVKIVAEVDVE